MVAEKLWMSVITGVTTLWSLVCNRAWLLRVLSCAVYLKVALQQCSCELYELLYNCRGQQISDSTKMEVRVIELLF